MKQKLISILVCLALFAGSYAFGQHPNDDCTTAGNLGSLPTPQSCTSGPVPTRGIGAASNFNLNNTLAVPAAPYAFMTGCQTIPNAMPSPSADVWYQVTVTGSVLNINITGLTNPNVGIWEGVCGSLTGRGCAVGTAGSLVTSFNGLIPGTTYYIQIAGTDPADTGNFTLNMSNDFDCNVCVTGATLTATPAPTNGTYQPGDTVTFCLDITDFTQVSANWFHGVEITWGPGWQNTPINLVPSGSCDGNGNWAWYNSVTSTATGNTFGPGFFYDSPLGPFPAPPLDGNPGNNYGDNCATPSVRWLFCWDLVAEDCPPGTQGQDMTVRANTLADGESGGWTSPACASDPDYLVSANLTCCIPATITQTDVLCNGESTGSITGQGQGTGPWDYTWRTVPAGTVLRTTLAQAGPDVLNNLPAGTYELETLDNFDNCTATVQITITEPPALNIALDSSFNVTCNGANDGRAYISATGGYPGLTGYNLGWNTTPLPTLGAALTGVGPGTYTGVVVDSNLCVDSIQVLITEPTAITITVDSFFNVTCNGANDGRAYVTAAGGTPGLTYSWNTVPVQNTASATGLAPGTYTVTVTDANNCTETAQVTIIEPPLLAAAIDSFFNVVCNGADDGRAYSSGAGGTPPYTFSWNTAPVQNTAAATGLPPGTWTVTVTDANNCTATAQATIIEPTAVVIAVDSFFDVTCNGANDGRGYVSATGGALPHVFAWNTVPPTIGPVATGLAPGTYTAYASDQNGCIDSIPVVIAEPTAITVTVDSFFDITCNGADDGRGYVSASGGTGTLTYAWNTTPVQNGPSATGLPVGTWTVTVTDANNCTNTAQVTIAEPPAIVLTPGSNPSTCGNADGQAFVNVAGGTPGYSYTWNTTPVQITDTAQNVTAGAYQVVVADANGCLDSVTVNVIDLGSPTAAIDSFFNASCNTVADGRAYASGSGGTTPYSFSWNTVPVQNTAAATGLAPGTYTVTVTDANNCTATAQATIVAPTGVVIAIDSFFDATCNGANDGRGYVSATGGTLPHVFAWNTVPPTIGPAATGLAPGTYTAYASDQNGCIDSIPVIIAEPTAITVTVDSFFDITCNGANDGRGYVSASGGTGTLTYAWNTTPVQNGPSATGLPVGTWTVTVTDANNCTNTAQVTIAEPPAIVLTPGSNPSTCGNADGQAFVNAAGGTPGYGYSWNTTPIQITDTAQNISAGAYQVIVSDANGCLDSVTVNVIDLGSPTAVIDSFFNTTCNTSNDGRAYASGTGGTTPYSFSWNTAPVQNTAAATGLAPGTYTVTLTDSNNCVSTAQVQITAPTAVVIVVDSFFDATCNAANDGRGYVSATGGTLPHVFAWNTIPPTIGPTATGLAPGTYTAYASDQNGCIDSTTVTISEPTPVVATVDSTIHVTCNGLNNGRTLAGASGGTPGYTYAWNTTPVQIGTRANGLAPGSYTVTVTDTNNCTATATTQITEPPVITLTPGSSPSTCGNTDGQAFVNAAGGTPGFTYSWPGTTPVQVTDTAQNVAAGSYTVIVTDNNGCIDSTIVMVIDQGSPVVTIDSFFAASCNGAADGSAFASASGGTGTITFAWNSTPSQAGAVATGLTAGGYTVTVTDSNNCTASANVTIAEPTVLVPVIDSTQDALCNGSADGMAWASASGGTTPYTFAWNTTPPQLTAQATGLTAGTYTVVVVDSNGCIDSVNAVVGEPTPVVVTVDSVHDALCFGNADGALFASANGGTAPYGFSWNTVPVQNTSTATGLSIGTYVVTATDTNGCVSVDSGTVNEPTALQLPATKTEATCGNSDGTATVTPAGGTPGYTYSWNTTPVQTTATATGLLAGDYTVIVTDSNGCQDSVTITILNLGAPSVSITASNDVSCNGLDNGIAFALGQGGTGPLTLSWNTTPAQVGDSAIGLTAGTYTVVVSDSLGCVDSTSVTITEPDPLVLDTFSTAITCFGEADGTAWVTVTGGTAPYFYQWNTNPVDNDSVANNLTAGTYTLNMGDIRGCQDSAMVTVGDALPVIAGFTSNPPMPASLDLSVATILFTNTSMGATSYIWDFGDGNTSTDTDPSHTYNDLGVFCVTLIAENDNGCRDTAVVCELNITQLVYEIPNTFTPNGDGTNDYFEIRGIEQYPNNLLLIYNRWGNLVYKKENYDNDWDGKNIFNDKQLPDGAYFYIFNRGDDQGEDQGDVVIFR